MMIKKTVGCCCAALAACVAFAGPRDAAKGNPRMDRSKLLVGAYCFRPCGDDEAHVKAIADCGVDFIIGVDARHRSLLDLFKKYGVGVFAGGVVSRWWGGDGAKAGLMRTEHPVDAYESQFADFRARWDHPAIWQIDLCDEPSAKDMPYLGELCGLVARRVPKMQAYINLYPNYARVATNSGSDEINQLGTATYREYVDAYCRTVPLDYISYDFYVYTPDRNRRESLYVQMYDNFNVVADACRRTGKSLWYVPQVNSYGDGVNSFEPTSENRLRFQAHAAMAYGAEAISWACWMPGWWTNNVYTADGQKTEQYEKLRKVNAEIHRFGPKYMMFRNTATHLVGFPSDIGLDELKVPLPEKLDAGVFQGVSTREGTPLLVGEMVPRGKDSGLRALFAVAAGDPFDEQPATRTVVLRLAGANRIRVQGADGEIRATQESDGTWTFPLAENAAVLVVAVQRGR